jgi:hypothetical protein
MKRFACFLIFLLILAQVDDLWTVTPFSPAAPVTDEDDEYLPVQPQSSGQVSSPRQLPVCLGLDASPKLHSCCRRGVPTPRELIPPTPGSLYVFMSLQI